MVSYKFQVQTLRRGKWHPVFYPFQSSTPLESEDLDFIMDKAKFIASNYDNIRVVKLEVYLIEQFS